jgi:hypothetical protein
MTQPQDTAGDYGYDMAHDAVVSGAARAHPPQPPAAPGRPARAGGTTDRGEDLEYDEAHDF